MSKTSDAIKAIHQYRYETGKTEIDMHEVAKWAVSKGWKLPKPKTPMELLAKELSKAAAQEMRHDKDGRAYRANHAVTTKTTNGAQLTFWIDIDEAPRKLIHKSLIQRREQMVGDAVQLSFDAEHWNTAHPKEEPIVIPLDFTPDVEWRKNGQDDEQDVG
jgi:hypothetical protein